MPKDNDLKRKYKFCIKLNKKELDVLNKFCEKYNIQNKSKFIRETLMKEIFNKMVEQDYPTLFSNITNEEPHNIDENKSTTDKNTDISHPKLF